jgi:hypothetical protein
VLLNWTWGHGAFEQTADTAWRRTLFDRHQLSACALISFSLIDEQNTVSNADRAFKLIICPPLTAQTVAIMRNK